MKCYMSVNKCDIWAGPESVMNRLSLQQGGVQASVGTIIQYGDRILVNYEGRRSRGRRRSAV